MVRDHGRDGFRGCNDQGERIMDTRIRDIDKADWEKFKQYCRELSVKCGEPISANRLLKSLIRDTPKGYLPSETHGIP